MFILSLARCWAFSCFGSFNSHKLAMGRDSGINNVPTLCRGSEAQSGSVLACQVPALESQLFSCSEFCDLVDHRLAAPHWPPREHLHLWELANTVNHVPSIYPELVVECVPARFLGEAEWLSQDLTSGCLILDPVLWARTLLGRRRKWTWASSAYSGDFTTLVLSRSRLCVNPTSISLSPPSPAQLAFLWLVS